MIEQNPVEAIIKRDQASDVLRGLPSTMVSNLFVSGSLAGMMWDVVPHPRILAFLAANAIINVTRALLAKRWLRQGNAARAPERILSFCWIGAFLSGLCWAAALLGCAYHGQAYSMEVALAYCGLNAGSIIQNKATRAPAIAFVLPNTSILIFLFAIEGSLSSQIVAVNLTLLTALMFRCSTEQEKHYLQSSRLRHEATELAASLKAANVAAGHALQRLEHSAKHDHLTGLFNRAAYQVAFEARLTRAVAERQAFWVMLIDLDRFKAINDTFGHAVGDELLVEVGARLRDILGPHAVVARLGGDEFAALIDDPPGGEGARRELGCDLACAIVGGLGKLVTPSGQILHAGASVGLAHCPQDGGTPTDLQIHADLALYAAKSEGRGTWRRFDEAMHLEARMKREIERDLAKALEDGSIRAWFQPQVDCMTGRAVGLEALLRWKHPKFGWIAPPDVVAAAAGTRQSRALTQAILKDACRMAQCLDASGHGAIVVSINVSPNEFGTYPIAEVVAAELDAHGLAASRLAIEITEEAVYSNERGGRDVETLTRMGVGIIVDDFGVAYSSVGSLRNLRFDTLKVDRSFIRGVADNAQDRVLMQAILAFARTLGVMVVAEGVETQAQFDVLRALGCPVLQGYLFASAMPETDALLWLARNDCATRFTPGRESRLPADRGLAVAASA